jgi:hypothetical protein
MNFSPLFTSGTTTFSRESVEEFRKLNKKQMEYTHTKGKWHNNGSEIRHSDTGIIIANVYAHNENNMPFNERMGNAKLIACAPELLQWLIDLLDINRSYMGEHEATSDYITEIEELIKRATT